MTTPEGPQHGAGYAPVVECNSCRELVGKSESTERHAGLAAVTSRRIARGWQEMYMCRVCGTRMLRVVMEPGSEIAGTPWTKAR